MKIRHKKISDLIVQIDQVILNLEKAEKENRSQIGHVHSLFKEGARNLIHYRSFRSTDLSRLQKQLQNVGLSLLGNSESHVLTSLMNCRHILKSLLLEDDGNISHKGISIKKSEKLQKKHAKDLFGYRSKGRRVRIMVTLPTEAAYDYQLVHDLVALGMNSARINCAHDTPEVWSLMIQNLNKAKLTLNKKCKVFMDLAGPKIRTGSIDQEPKVRKFKPYRNKIGEVLKPADIHLVTKLDQEANNELQVDADWLRSLSDGDTITFKDARKKSRSLFVQSVHEDRVITTCRKTSYIKTGTVLTSLSTLQECPVLQVPVKNNAILLREGDQLRLLKDQIPGRPAVINKNGDIITSAYISSTSSEIFDAVKIGERILFDDGKIGGVVTQACETEIMVEIIQANLGESKLKADKGINLPDSELNMNGLTLKDKLDLNFVVRHADGVNVSFINSAKDVSELYSELERLGAKEELGVVLKIENRTAYDNLIEILLTGMQRYPIGVMIARGDLAIEAGWGNLPRIQNEILRICDSAYVSTIWATQVLESLAKKGIPSRSELTDVASSLKADCVMLNKGTYILNALTLLHNILSNMNTYRDKDVRMFEAIEPV